MHKIQDPIFIMGIELRTTNDHGQAFKDIPPFWDKFINSNYSSKILNKLNDDIYAVYTHFENEGQNNKGMYSLIIGCKVSPDTIPQGEYTKIKIPAGNYLEFPVEKGRPDKVGEVWQSIWAIPDKDKQNWRFSCEFECYRSSGEISIFTGIK